MAREHDVLTVREVAEMKGITTQSVYEALRAGRLKGRKTGGTWLVKREDAEKWQPRA